MTREKDTWIGLDKTDTISKNSYSFLVMSNTVVTAAHLQGTTCKLLPDYQPGYIRIIMALCKPWKYEELKVAEDNEHDITNRTVSEKVLKARGFNGCDFNVMGFSEALIIVKK